MNIRALLRGIIYGHKADSQRYIAHLRKIGVHVGENVTIYTPSKTTIDECYPWLTTIGNNVKITQGVIILNHDYAWSVLHNRDGCVLGASGKVTIGDNVFIGMNTIITRNVAIGNNVIIGAGSVVTKNCLDNGVYAGNPARRIAELDDYLEKRRQAQLEEAVELAVEYKKRYNRPPPEEVFHEFFMLFETVDSAKKKPWCHNKMKNCGNYEASVQFLANNKPLFKSFDAFLEHCFLDEVT